MNRKSVSVISKYSKYKVQNIQKSKSKIKNFKDTIYSRGQIEVELGAESVPEISDLGLIDSTNRNKLENYGASSAKVYL